MHSCTWPNCPKETDLLMCSKHWYRLPPQLRQRYMAARKVSRQIPEEITAEVERYVSTHGDKQ